MGLRNFRFESRCPGGGPTTAPGFCGIAVSCATWPIERHAELAICNKLAVRDRETPARDLNRTARVVAEVAVVDCHGAAAHIKDGAVKRSELESSEGRLTRQPILYDE